LDNKGKSLTCNSIEKIGVYSHLIALLSLLVFVFMKEPSASLLKSPVIQFGFNGKFINVVKEFLM